MPEEFPRLLFFTTEIPQSRNAGSMQLFRALKGYPGSRMRVIGPALAAGAEGLPCEYLTRDLLAYRMVHTRLRRWATGLNALDVVEPGLRRTLALARGFSPDLVVTVMDNFAYYKHAWHLARRLGAGLVTVTMDNPQTFEEAHPLLKGAFDRRIGQIYRSAALSLGVSAEMCAFILSRFGRPSELMQFGPPEGLSPRPAALSRGLRGPGGLTLGYAGSLGLGYRDGILSILPGLQAAGARLVVYSSWEHKVDHPCVVNRGFLPPEALWDEIKRDCDAVLLPYAFSGRFTDVYRTHFPTKISEYCWTGMPIVVTGPEFATGLRWAQRHPSAAVAICSQDAAAVAAALREVAADGPRREALAAGSAAAAAAEFDPGLVRRRFADHMRAASAAHRGAAGAAP